MTSTIQCSVPKMTGEDPLTLYSLWATSAAIVEEPSDNVESSLHDTSILQPTSTQANKTTGTRNSTEGKKTIKSNRIQALRLAAERRVLEENNKPQFTVTTTSQPHLQVPKSDIDPLSPEARTKKSPNRIKEVKGHLAEVRATSDRKTSPAKDVKKSWSQRALSKTKGIFTPTVEPSAAAFEEFRRREFARADIKEGDNAAAKLHVSSQTLPPEAISLKSSKPPPIPESTTNLNTEANKFPGSLKSPFSNSDTGSSYRARKIFSSGRPSKESDRSRNSSLASIGVSTGGSIKSSGGDSRRPSTKSEQLDGAKRSVTIAREAIVGDKKSMERKPSVLTHNTVLKAAATDPRW